MTNEQRTEPTTITTTTTTSDLAPTAAVACGVLGVLAAVWTYWLVMPAVVFGVAAIALGVGGRRRGSREAGSVALTLGIVALLALPSVIVVVDGESDYARNCALNPPDPDC